MKTTVKVSISGIAFTIDEDAYQVLNNYLNTLKKHFSNKPEGKEVVEDIEARMAELLSMRLSSHEQVVSMEDAQEVIRIMGNPSDLIDDEQSPNNSATSQTNTPVSVRKRLYRDGDNRIIAGVCSGLGNYFGVDPVIFRLLFIVFAVGINIIPFFHGFSFIPFKGFAIWTYIILWIAVPQANTPQQKLEMTGKNPSIDDIERKVREEQKKNNEKGYGENKSEYKSPTWGIANFIGLLVRIFVALIAGCILFTGAIALIAIVGSLFGFTYYTGFSLNDFFDIAGVSNTFFKVMLTIAVVYPLFMLIYWGAKLLFRFKLRDKAVMIIAFIIWILSLAYIFGYGVSTAAIEIGSRKESMKKIESINIATPADTLYLNLTPEYQESSDNAIGELMSNKTESPRIWIAEHHSMKTLFIVPEIKIRYSPNVENYTIELRKRVYAKNRRKADIYAEELKFNYEQKDSLILMEPLMFNKEKPLRKIPGYYDIIVYAPEGKKVVIQEPLLSKTTGRSDEDSWAIDFSAGISLGDD